MAQQLVDQFIYQFSDADGLLVGGQVFFYEAGSTTTKLAIYQDAAETTELANPQTLGSLGELQNVIYLNGDYNIVIFDRDGVEKFQRDNFDVSDTSTTVLDWMNNAQSAGGVIGKWTTVVTEGVTIAEGDIVFGDSAGSGLYELVAGGDPNNDPESDTYDPNTGIGSDWINLSISSAEITESDIDNLQDQIDDISADFSTQGYFYGLQVTNSTLDNVNDLDFAVGTANDSTDAARITATSAFTKAIDATWAEGSNQGGRPTGTNLTSSGWWYCFIIGNSNNKTSFDFGFDENIDASLLLNGSNAGADGYDIYRLVDAWYWDAINTTLLQIDKRGFQSYLQDRQEVRAASSATAGDETLTAIAPPNSIGQLSVLMRTNDNSNFQAYSQVHSSSSTPSSVGELNCDISARRVLNESQETNTVVLDVAVNASSEFGIYTEYDGAGSADVEIAISSRGYYFDPR